MLVKHPLIEKNFQKIDSGPYIPAPGFWVQRKGSMDTVGKPTKEFSKEHIGVRVVRDDVLVPDYLYYAMEHIYNQGYYKQFAKGTLKLVNISVNDVKNIRLG